MDLITKELNVIQNKKDVIKIDKSWKDINALTVKLQILTNDN